MPLLQSPSPLAPDHARATSLRAWPLVVALVGGLAVLGLAAAGRLAAEPAAAAILSLAAVGALVWLAGAPAAKAVPAQEVPTDVPGLAGEALAEVAEGLPDPVLVVSGYDRSDFAGRRILFSNQAARELFRVAADTMLVTAVRNPEVLALVDEALFNGREGRTAYEGGGVHDRYWTVLAKPLAAGPDGHRRALLVLRDQTDARRNERMRADFLANASHELRTPLASLTGFIETLRGHAREDPEARDRFLAIMHGQAERMRRLIDDLMSLSRIELGEHIPPSGNVDMAASVIDVLDALGPLAKERCVSLRPSLPPLGEAVAAADRDQIVQVIQNLVENAVKYTPEGGEVVVEVLADLSPTTATARVSDLAAHFSILTPDHAAGRRYVAVRVRDFGPGIARNHLPRLTERFYRVEGQKARERPGTGLGLAIVKHIVNRHRGGLIVESAEGAGALFSAYVPMADPSDADTAA
ncbi:MAG: histidine kinase [Caulobacteraceae bacterium]|nr:histidine kinase [Caulobacteraceae bacterium]